MRIPAPFAPLLFLMASVVGVSVLGWIIPPLRRALILNPSRVRSKGEIWRLLTAAWVHSGFGHLAVNMLSLYFFGEPAIRSLGVTPFVALYISAAAVAFVPSLLRNMHQPGYNTLGASGAVAAVMFSAILLNPKLRIMLWFVPVPIPALIFAVGYLAFTAWQSYRSDSDVNHTAHFAGALYGVLFTYAFEPARVVGAMKSLG